MKRISTTVIVCALILVSASISDVLAVDTTKLEQKEFKLTGTAKRYDADGYDGSGQITQGTLLFGNPDQGVIAAHNIASDLMISLGGGFFELYSILELGPYTPGVDKIKSTECTMSIYDQTLTELMTYGPGPCDAKIVFSSTNAFTGTITIPDFWDIGVPYVLTVSGKFAGKYPLMVKTPGTSLRDALRNRAPGGVRKLLSK